MSSKDGTHITDITFETKITLRNFVGTCIKLRLLNDQADKRHMLEYTMYSAAKTRDLMRLRKKMHKNGRLL